MSPTRRIVLVVLLAVLGIAVAAAITWGTSQLVRQRIGLASEPLTAGRRLLAPATRRAAPSARSQGTTTTRTGGGESATGTATAPITTVPSTATSPPAPPGTASEGTAIEGTRHAPASGEPGAAGGRARGEGADAGSRRDD